MKLYIDFYLQNFLNYPSMDSTRRNPGLFCLNNIMIICVCNDINCNSLRSIIKENKITRVKEIQKLGICVDCKKCCLEIREIIEDEQNLHEKC